MGGQTEPMRSCIELTWSYSGARNRSYEKVGGTLCADSVTEVNGPASVAIQELQEQKYYNNGIQGLINSFNGLIRL